ncbi:MAG: DHA2 family efflux MFS transporter permease subunit [Clostridium sp.]|jgi:DHA2 family lincomycin resistance protein-like MFS transporter|uniref:DHA2 family efflux MFS transporter permease subunit n=1 Tax=Clostridium sp. TaxID=1506 RepID=UPI0025C7258D|nr:DHA2 family efflux MFS transporter permease subunit [Clostridium sp.]MCH3963449.1 DHA2 family efflux MFS transporter permease subunit [Clostridium sp.]MCI1716683.1 DHA2 family efflux MFS transporter permease subunit [Clostridium sp.]MCI1801133.1 DHA2 family efflux MFS transporter permease subunit [Clostridium sp.]MCI1814869.1 DHA2 family efflux MFS transporter permease subunit [Clostridium sp.]MCI1871770.1 DHA2 family efflux MFS transporter permease subunit [Clostridium sp.]
MLQQQTFSKARVDVKHPYLVMMGLYLGTFSGMFSETSLNIALPQLMDTFNISMGIAQWLVVGYMLVIGIVLPFTSLLMKCFSVRKLTIFALGAFMIGSLISGFAFDFRFLLAGRMIQGIGTGMVLPMMFSVILEVFPSNKIGSAMGVASLVIMFAPVIGPTLSGIFLGMLSWRWIFFSFVIILAVAMIFTAIYMVNTYKLTKPKIDGMSCLTSIIGFGCIVLGVSLISEFGFSVPVILILIIGIIAIIVYAKRQMQMEIPVLDLKALKISKFRTGAVLVMVNFSIVLSAMYLLPQYIQNGLMIPVATTGLILLPGGLINAFVSYISGSLYDKFGAKYLVKIGFFISIVGIFLLLFTSTSSSVSYIIFCNIILSIGIPLAMSPAQSSGLNGLPKNMSRDGSTIINTMQQIVGAVSTAIATCMLGIGQTFYFSDGGKNQAEAFVKGSHYGFYFALVLSIIGFLVSFRIKDTKHN